MWRICVLVLVLACVGCGAPGPDSVERRAVSKALRERYWDCTVTELWWGAPRKPRPGDLHMVRVRYRVRNANGIAHSRDESWAYECKTGKARFSASHLLD